MPDRCLFGVCAEASVWVGLILWLAYLLLFFFVRAWVVVGMLREFTRAEIEGTRRRIRLQWEEPAQTTPSEQVLLDHMEGLLQEAERKVSWTLGDRLRALFWNGGAELAAWRLIHDAERLAVAGMAVPHLKARLERAQGDLAELPEERQKIWKQRLDEALKDLNGQKKVEARAVLSEFLADLYETRDGRFARVLKLQNLLAFLILLGLAPALALVLAGYGPILLAGAVGGLLSRMARVYRGSPQTPDYGLTWAQVFPVPLWGALSAWAGLHLIALLQSQGILSLNTLGDLSELLVPPILWAKEWVPLLALGALLGLSERLLERLVEKTGALWEKREEKKPAESSPGKTPGELIRRMQLQLETEEQEKDGARATRRMTLDVLQEPGEAGPSGPGEEAPPNQKEPDLPSVLPRAVPPSGAPQNPLDAIPTR